MAFINQLDALGFTFHARLDEDTGTAAADRINANTGLIGGSPTLDAAGGGVDNNAGIDFAGSSRQYVSWSEAAAVDGEVINNNVRSNRALLVAFETDSNSAAQLLYQQGGSESGFGIYLNGGGLPYFNMTNGSGANVSGAHAQISINTAYVRILSQDDTNNQIIDRLYDQTGLVSELIIDITSILSEALGVQLAAVGTSQGDLGSSAARFRNHGNQTWLSSEKHWNGVIDEIAYKAGAFLTVDEMDRLAKSYFKEANASAPNYTNIATAAQDDGGESVTIDISGSGENWALSEGDLIIAAVTVDENVAASLASTEGLTQLYSEQTDNLNVTGGLFAKVLTASDAAAWNQIQVTWSGTEDAVLTAYHYPVGTHGGLGTSPAPNRYDAASAPELPALTLSANSQVIAAVHINAAATVSINPKWYITGNQTSSVSGGHCTQWTGADEFTASQSAEPFSLTSGQAAIAGAVEVLAPASGNTFTASPEAAGAAAIAGEVAVSLVSAPIFTASPEAATAPAIAGEIAASLVFPLTFTAAPEAASAGASAGEITVNPAGIVFSASIAPALASSTAGEVAVSITTAPVFTAAPEAATAPAIAGEIAASLVFPLTFTAAPEAASAGASAGEIETLLTIAQTFTATPSPAIASAVAGEVAAHLLTIQASPNPFFAQRARVFYAVRDQND